MENWLGTKITGLRGFLQWLKGRWRYALAGVLVAAVSRQVPLVLPALFLGAAAGTLASLPKERTGAVQVRLELGAQVLSQLQRQLLCWRPPPIDREALLQRARSRACGGCVHRDTCLEQRQLTVTALEDSRTFSCRKPARLGAELLRSREQLRLLTRERKLREECRQALAGQYGVMAAQLRRLSDTAARGNPVRLRYRVGLGVRTRGKGICPGDRWAAFSGAGGRYYVLLCDGMGTGARAAESARETICLLRKMLRADIPAAAALRSLNAMLTLAERAGEVTVDLLELRLDTGNARLYKWGAAPSYLVRDAHTEKIGTATPPPGLWVAQGAVWSAGLSLRRGEALILLSDGVCGEDVPRRVTQALCAPPGELAERLLEGCSRGDDATAAVVRLHLRDPGKSIAHRW